MFLQIEHGVYCFGGTASSFVVLRKDDAHTCVRRSAELSVVCDFVACSLCVHTCTILLYQ